MFLTKSSNNMIRQLNKFNILYSTKSNKCINNSIQIRNTSRYFQLIDDLVRSTTTRKFKRTYRNDYHTLKQVYAESGAVAELPKWYRFGILKVVLTIFSFLMVGSIISKVGVKILEENDIFKPDDDDDDEDDDD